MPRVDVTLRGTPPVGVHATVTPNTVARTVSIPTPPVVRGITVTPATVAPQAVVVGATAVAPSREDLVVGDAKPDAFNTGTLPNVTRTTVNGNVTLDATWSGQIYENRTVNGRITVTAANVTIRNVEIRSQSSSPGTMISCFSGGVSNLVIEDVYIRPATLLWQYDNAIKGHSFTARRVRMEGCIDGIGIFNTTVSTPYASNATVSMCWINRMIYWTSQTGGTIHPSDTISHNDGIQHQGGWGTNVIGTLIDARLEKQAGHWQVTNPSVEPYSTITLNSLADGGPWNTIPDRGDGNEASGRYNQDSRTPTKISLTGLLIGNNVGTSRELTMTKNWIYGGVFGVNLGGFSRPASESPDPAFLIDASGNRFDRTQGNQGAGGNDTHTFSGAGSGWAGSGDVISHAGTSLRNYYEDQGNTSAGEINFRGD